MDYIRATCLKCKEPELRVYLAKHVETSFSKEEKEAWDIFNLVANYEEKFKYGHLLFLDNNCATKLQICSLS